MAEVSYYYSIVVKHLKDVGTWEATRRKFPPKAIEAAVKKILERLIQHGINPEFFDWGSTFERLRDYDTVEAFIRALTEDRIIPPSFEEEMEASAEAIERQLDELLEEAAKADISILRRIRDRISSLLEEEEEISKLKIELVKLKEKAEKEKELREEYARKITLLQNKISSLKEQIRKLREEVEQIPRKEELWKLFSSLLEERGIPAPPYRLRFEDEWPTIRYMPPKMQEDTIRLLAEEIIREEEAKKAPPPKVAPPPPPRPPPIVPTPPERRRAPMVPIAFPPEPPGVMVRYDPETGETFPAPDDKTVFYLMRIFPMPEEYWLASPRTQKERFGWPPTLHMLKSSMKYKRRLIDPTFWDWINELIRLLEEAGAVERVE